MAELFTHRTHDHSFILSLHSHCITPSRAFHHSSQCHSPSHSCFTHSFHPCHRPVTPIKISRRCTATPLERFLHPILMKRNYILKHAFQHQLNIPSLMSRTFPPSPLENYHRFHWNIGYSIQLPEHHRSTPPLHSSIRFHHPSTEYHKDQALSPPSPHHCI